MASDRGSQIVTIRFHRPVDSDVVNKRFQDIRMLGIYKGGRMDWSADTVTLSPLVCEISDGTHQVRVETIGSVSQALLNNQYLVLRWAYTGAENTDFMEIVSVAVPETNDVIVGKVDGGIVLYAERTTPNTHHLFLRVEEMETPSSSVRVRGGVGHAGSIHRPIIDQHILITANSGETVYVYVNDIGGVVSSRTVADYAGKALLAKIVYPVDGIIENEDIEDARSFVTPPAIPDGVTLERDSTGKLKIRSRNQYLSTHNNILQLQGSGDWTKASLGTVKNQNGISVSADRITLTANRKYALSYGIKGSPKSTPPPSAADPFIRARWHVVSGDSSWNLDEISYAEHECPGTDFVDTHFSMTCYIIPSSTTVIELQIYTQAVGSGQIAQVGLVVTNIMSMD